MENTNYINFKRSSRNEIKILFLLYCLKKSNCNVDYTNLKQNEIADYILKQSRIDNNLAMIDKHMHEYSYLFKDCLKASTNNLSSYLRTYNNAEEIKNDILEIFDKEMIRDESNTPDSLSDLCFKILNNNKKQNWLDIGCSTGCYLKNISNKIEDSDELYGLDIDFDSLLLTSIRLYLMGVNYHLFETNVLESVEIINEKGFDSVFCNMPFMIKSDYLLEEYNKYNKYISDVLPRQSLDWMFVDRTLQLLKKDGKAAVVLSDGNLFNLQDQRQRKLIVDQNLIECIIKLPKNLFNYCAVSTSLLILNKDKNNEIIKMIDASNLCTNNKRFSELDVDSIIDLYNGENSDKCIDVNIETIKENQYYLNVNKYLNLNDFHFENETPLSQLTDVIIRGCQITASETDNLITDSNEYFSLLSVGDIHDGTFDISSLKRITPDNKRFEKFIIKDGDLLISGKSTTVKVAVASIKNDEKVVATGSVIVIRCKKDKIDPLYLKAFFDSSYGNKLLSSIQTGTIIISINASALLNINIPLLDKEKRDKISYQYSYLVEQLNFARKRVNQLENEISSVFEKEAEVI